jgi:hypothetical protein
MSCRLRKTRPDRPNDWLFVYNGRDVGRCCRRSIAGGELRWHWSIFVGTHIRRLVNGVPIAGHAETLDRADQQFQASFERMVVAGVVRLKS